MKRAVFVAAAVCAACGGTAASPSNAGSGSTPSVPTPAATSAKLKVHVSGAGRVVSAPAGLDCRDDCGATFASSAMVVLTAMADADHAFSGFGGACSGMVCVLTLSGAATFAEYNAALALVQFTSSGGNPTNFGADNSRTISWTVSDGLISSDVQSSTGLREDWRLHRCWSSQEPGPERPTPSPIGSPI